jgi:hydroxymethylpyrimidine/phosphomethylpyrimidine kinase
LIAAPNVPEARALTGLRVETWEDMREAAHAIAAMGPANVVIKGGKRDGRQVTDLLYDGRDYRDYTAERVEPAGIAGAGTTFAAAIAATLAKGETVRHSVAAAKAYVTKALQSSYDLGGRPAPHLFYRYWQPASPGPPSQGGG